MSGSAECCQMAGCAMIVVWNGAGGVQVAALKVVRRLAML